MTKLYLVCGSSGEYSDRTEWPVALYETEAEARAVAEAAEAIEKENHVIHEAWYWNVYYPWYKRMGRPSGNDIRAGKYPDEPIAPEPKPNLFDPESGGGDTYWVVEVEIRKHDAT